MARSRAAEHQRSRSKTALIEDLTHRINKFQEILAAINDLSQEGFPYRDAAQSKAELQFRECLRQTFGERSQEFQQYRNFKLRTADNTESAQSLTVIKGLIQSLEDRKLELQGLKPPPKPEPSPEPSLSNTARMVLVSPAIPTTVTGQTNAPMTVAVAMTTNVGPPISAVPSAPPLQPAAPEPTGHTQAVSPDATPALTPTVTVSPMTAPTPMSTPIPTPALTPSPIPAPTPAPLPAAEPIVSLVATSPPPSAPAVQPTASPHDRSPEVTPASRSPIAAPIVSSIPMHPHNNPATSVVNDQSTSSEMSPPVARAPQDLSLDKQALGLSVARSVESALDQDPLHLIRKVCLRFHAVARQLRLRKDYRPTLEVDDDYDLQDLLCALLKVEFDEVATDDWTPPYTGGTPRTTLLVNRDQIAVVAKKTRSGLATKELADHVAADAAYYRDQGRCSTLFCFLYDPEGRIGSPKRLETTLTSVSEHYRVEVLVAPR